MMFPGKGDWDKGDGRIDDLVAQLGVDRSQLTYPLGEAALLYAQQLSGGQLPPLQFLLPVDPSFLSTDGQSYFHWTNEVQSRFEKVVDELTQASQESSDGKPENSTTKGKAKFSTSTRASSLSGDPEGETDSFSLEELEDMLSLDSDDMDTANHAEVQDISMLSSSSNEIHRQQQIDSVINKEDCACSIGIEESLLLQSELNIDFPLSMTAQKNHKMQSDFIMEGGLNVEVQKNHYMQPEVKIRKMFFPVTFC
uniref:Uncharacterized protein n=1 Tax=Kalanchoe fedtschenkoi TaxID=63787 RepID=A0A7N0TE97_KALFE